MLTLIKVNSDEEDAAAETTIASIPGEWLSSPRQAEHISNGPPHRIVKKPARTNLRTAIQYGKKGSRTTVRDRDVDLSLFGGEKV